MNNKKVKHTLKVRDFEHNKIIEEDFECIPEELKNFADKIYNLIHNFEFTHQLLYSRYRILVGKEEMKYICISKILNVEEDEHTSICKNLIHSVFDNVVFVPVDSMLEIVGEDPIQSFLTDKYNLMIY